MKEYWAIKQAHIRNAPGNGQTVTHAPAGSLLRWTGKAEYAQTKEENGKKTKALWMEVKFTNWWGRSYLGWTYAGWLEEVAKPAPVDPIDEVVHIPDEMRTPDPFDAQQYLELDGKVLQNLCGEFCAAYLGNDSIKAFLDKAETRSPHAWLAGVKRDMGLGISAMETMLEAVYGFEMLRFADGLKDPYVGTLVSPGKMLEMLSSGWLLVAGVKIGGATGKLISSGRIGHWVVLAGVQPYGVNEGQVEIYNPFPNRMKTLPYSDFTKSMKAWHRGAFEGIWVKAEIEEKLPVVSGQVSEIDDLAIGKFLDDVSTFIEESRDWMAAKKKELDALK